jgi:hypothetical protein
MSTFKRIGVGSVCAILLSIGTAFSQASVVITGTVKDTSNQPLPDATVILVGANLSAETDANGTFSITGTAGVLPGGLGNSSRYLRPYFKGSQLVFSIPVSSQQVRIDLYNIKGARIATVLNQRLQANSYQVSPLANAGRQASSMLYLVRVQIGNEAVTLKVPYVAGVALGQSVLPLQPVTSVVGQNKAVLAARDSLEVSLCGYATCRVPVDSFMQSGIAVTMHSTELTPAGEVRVDSLFNALRDLIGSLDSVNSPNDIKSKDFASLRDGFHTILVNENQYNMRANVGYMVSSLLALNTDTLVWRLVDSLDAYFTAIDTMPAPAPMPKKALAKKPGLMQQTMAAGGVTALGKSLAAASLPGLAKLAPSVLFPKFITIAYIQSIAENDVLPVLDSIVAAAGRIENNLSCGLLSLPIDRDTFELDKGEIYPIDMAVHLLRACLNGFCAYEFDLYAAGTTDYSWIDTLQDAHPSTGRYIYSLLGDTLDMNYLSDDTAMGLFLFRSIKWNMQRSGFLTLRGNTITRVKADLLAVPAKFKAGLAYIRSDINRNNSDDIIRLTDIAHMDNDLVDVPGRMTTHGVSTTLANHFRTPEAIADFVDTLLIGPYAFDETIDSTHIAITVNLTAMLDNPVTDLRTIILPNYKWMPDSEWTVRRHDYWVNPAYDNMFCCNLGDSIAVNPVYIDSVVSYGMSKCCYLNTYYNWTAETDSSLGINIPVALLDSADSLIPFDQIDSLIDARTFLPYFSDYTFGGLFPLMNRQAWIDLIYQ